MSAQNAPVFALQQLTAMLRVAFDRGLITNIRALIATHSSVEKMVLAHAACQRVQLTPEPYSYTALMKTSSVLWARGRAARTYAHATARYNSRWERCYPSSVAKLDEIAAELQNPYGATSPTWAWDAINRRLQRELAQSTLSVQPVRYARRRGVRQRHGRRHRRGRAIKLGRPGVGDWADNEKPWKAARLGGGRAKTA